MDGVLYWLKRIAAFILIAGLCVALLSIFGSPVEVIKAGWNWLVWAIGQVADLLTGNKQFVDTITTDPASIPTK
ncbi:hypothetical protein G1C97_0482 [Bifidobacterium sp. DSM 109959]|uniref:Uncharacterized protein n=2 Tax=Bifidobacterium olomucense TaxID=2675324 RepID=A0A7Y0HWD4_9BIFI|nr:hypothetical protein [Bifidobacterium sp. DSM 109959]